MEIEEDVKVQSGEDDEAAAEGDSFDSLYLQHAAGEEEDEDSSDSSWVAYEYRQTSNRCKTLWGRLCSGAPILALARGTELQTRLSSEHPSFILQLQESHVTKKFFLDVPVEFCKLHLPAHNVEVTLEDEKGESYSVNFHPGTVQNLIIGWKKFAVAHKLLEDDVIVFHLLKPCFFKVYIIVANEPIIVACANRTGIDVHANEGNKGRNSEATDKEIPDLDTVQQGVKKSSSLSSPNIEPGQDHSSTDEFHTSDMMEAFPLSNCDADSEGHKRLGNVGVLAREEKGDSSNSSGMVILKPPSVENHVAVCSKRALRLHRKKSYKQVGYENQQTIKRWLTKTQRMDSEACALALERAKELQTNLSSEHPSFIKQMHPSSVNGKGLLAVPMEFCRLHLPNHDAEVTLEDENGESYIVKFVPTYIIHQAKFIAGWKRFSDAHKLLASDTVVFQLLRPCYFKVYIIRVSDLAGSTDLTNSNVNANKGKDAPHLDTDQGRVRRCSMLSNPSLEPVLDHSSTDEFHSSEMEASPSSKCDSDFDVHKHLDNLEVRAREVKEKDLPASCMETSKPPSVENNIPVSRLSRKKTYKQVGYENQQTIKRWLTKTQRMDSEACALALERAKELQTNLSSDHPSFIKQMHPSSVNGKGLLAVPMEFCRLHLPNHDAEVTLEDENGESYIVKFVPTYIIHLAKFVAGWKRFSDAHKLLASDTVVFQLLRPCYFKVYIIRVSDLAGSTDLTNSNVNANKGKDAPHLDTDQGRVRRCSMLSNPSLEPVLDHSSTDEFHSSEMEASPSSKCDSDFDVHKHLDNLEVRAREVKEKDLPASSCMETSKPPSVENNIPVSRLSRKKTYKQVGYENQQTIKRWLTKTQRMDSEACALALERAKELQTNLSSDHPSFIKQMHPSSVNGKGLLAVPMEFCRLHLPNHDAEVTLEDENGESYIVKFVPTYIIHIARFIAGWKRFSDAHKLLASDTVVFQLLRPCYFKVYIIRVSDPAGSTDLTNSNVNANKGKDAPHLDTDQGCVKRYSMLSNPSLEPVLDHSSTDEFHSSEMEASPSSKCDSDFEVHKHLDNLEVRAWEVKEKDLPASSCMETSKPPSVENNIPVSRLSRKKTYKQVGYENQQTIKRSLTKRQRLDSEACALALERAKELQTNLSSEHPSFIKQMRPSDVNRNARLDVPMEFCRLYLPNHDAEVTLEDANGESYIVKLVHTYIIHIARFTAGWKRFSDAHKLLASDTVVFQLLRPCYFKVYIIRVSELIGNKGKKRRKWEAADRKGHGLAPHLDTDLGSIKGCSFLSNPSLDPAGLDHSSGDEFHSSDMEASRLSKHHADFEGHKHLDNLEVQARGEKEKDSPASSSMVTSKPPYRSHHMFQNNIPVSRKGISKLSRKKTHKKVAYANQKTVKRWLTKRRRMDSEACALERAKELQTNLSSEHPSFIKQLFPSQLSARSVMNVPMEFYRLHLPNNDAEITLEDENGVSYIVKFFPAGRCTPRFIGGWKRFSDAHKLIASDIAVFHLLRPCYFKVYIIRANVNANKGKKKTKNVNQQTIKCWLTKRRRMDSEACALALERAKELQTNLSSEHPSFIKKIHTSNVNGKAALAVPMEFCRLHLPNHDAEVTLEDENGESCIVKFVPTYIIHIARFIAGWKRFSDAHKLLASDTVVFQLLRPCYFKVYIIRSSLLSSNPSLEPGLDHSSTKKSQSSSDTEACTLSGHDSDFENFKIIVNGEIVDPELPRSIRFKYYGLCCSQKSFLHHKLLKNVNPALAAGIITGTLEVEEAIRSCKLSTSKDDFAAWDSTLEGFKNLGMEVGFLRERLKVVRDALRGPQDHDAYFDQPFGHDSDFEACTLSGNDSDFENFKIIVNGEIVDDPELARSNRLKYYELCCSQKSFLHHKLVRYVNPALAAGIITGTLEVEEAIRSYKLSTSSKDEFATWDSTLEGFKNLGMEVGFLHERLKGLARIESEFRESEKFKRYKEVIKEERQH